MPATNDTQPMPSAASSAVFRPPLLVVLAAPLAVMCLCGSLVALVLWPQATTHDLIVIVDSNPVTTSTSAADVAAVLAELGVILNEGDTVTPALDSPITPRTTIRVQRARSITLTLDGQSRIYRTTLTNPADILRGAGVEVAENDQVVVDGTVIDDAAMLAVWPVPAGSITLRRALSLSVTDDGRRFTVQTTAATVGDALFEAGINLYLADRVTPDLNTPVRDGLDVQIDRSYRVFIAVDGTTLETRASGSTVADALQEAGVVLIGQDYAVPGESTPLLDGVRVRVIRVTEELLYESETRPYETIYQADATMELDQRAELQTGQAGIIQTTIRVRYENGIEISREVEESIVQQETRDQVIAYGTNVVLRTVDTPDGPRQYWRRIRMYATSYHPEALGGDNVTAIGMTLQKGVVGSNPDIIRYRSEVYVPGYGVGIMADTGALPQPLWIDLGYSDADYVPWSRYVDVYLLAPVPDTFPYILPGQ